jgi:hypothetical protein
MTKLPQQEYTWEDAENQMEKDFQAECKENSRSARKMLKGHRIKDVDVHTSTLGGVRSITLIFEDKSEVKFLEGGIDFSKCNPYTSHSSPNVDSLEEPSTTLPYIHCSHCGMLIIGVVKSDSMEKMREVLGHIEDAHEILFNSMIGVDEVEVGKLRRVSDLLLAAKLKLRQQRG